MVGDKHKVIALVGGIGSGKSVVARMLSVMGYAVYDCDSRAKVLLDQDPTIRHLIAEKIGHDTLDSNGALRRDLLARIVFSDPSKLCELNAITHPAVRDDIRGWVAATNTRDGICFVETAIAVESGIDTMVDGVWEVMAPEEIRIDRVMQRNGLLRSQVLARMASQRCGEAIHKQYSVIVNDNVAPVLPQVESLLLRVVEE